MNFSKVKKWSFGLYWLFAVLYWEAYVHLGMYGDFIGSFRFALGFGTALALAIAALTGFLPKRALFPVSLILSGILTVLYGSQLVYCFIFGTPYSVRQMGLGAGAMTQFWRELMGTISAHAFEVLLLLVPFALLIAAQRFQLLQKPRLPGQAVMLVLGAAVALGVYGDICRGGSGMFSNYYFLTSSRSATTQTMERYGVSMTFLLELTRPEAKDDGQDTGLIAVQEPEPEPEQPADDSFAYNVLPIDFDALSQSTEDEKLKALNSYCAQTPGTRQNAYTGMLKDYNLIYICAESFSPAAVDPEITPTLYKLTHEGFLFRNYYTSYPNTTIDGEYTLTQGLYPDPRQDKYNSSMMHSSKNLLPFTLGNLFSKKSIPCYGYHNNVGSYFQRDQSHPNMGYQMKFNRNGLTLTSSWPASDLEMMEQTVDDYIHEPQFHAYYMTFSGHYQYNPGNNAIAQRNYDAVKDLPLPETAQKAYLSCHIELDKALEYLLSRLEEEGIADKTAIVMAADHTPYGLTKEQYFQMLNQPEDFFSWYKSDLVFWVGGMEPVEVDAYCSTADILPTVLNLWGLPYDSRMLAGNDVFSDSLHMAVLIDHSFLTEQVWFNTNTGEVRYLQDPDQVPQDYVDKMNRLVAARFDFSAQVLRNDYYRFVFGD